MCPYRVCPSRAGLDRHARTTVCPRRGVSTALASGASVSGYEGGPVPAASTERKGLSGCRGPGSFPTRLCPSVGSLSSEATDASPRGPPLCRCCGVKARCSGTGVFHQDIDGRAGLGRRAALNSPKKGLVF